MTPYDRYIELAKAHVSVRRKCEMIEPGTDPWYAWQTYFKARNIKLSLHTMRQIENKAWAHPKYGVPTLWPWEFDKLADRQIDRPEKKPEPTPEEKAELVKRMKQFSSELRLNGVFKSMPKSKGAA